MISAYDEIVEFIAAGTSPSSVVSFVPSSDAKERVAELIHRQKTEGITEAESAELDRVLHLEHIMRLAKVRARHYLSNG
jgi:hypothetical protein